MYTVISTKKLSKSQQEYLIGNGITLVQESFICVKLLDVHVDHLEDKHIVFTSQNAIRSVLLQKQRWKSNYVYCVGESSFKFLWSKGVPVVCYENNAKSLARYIVDHVSCKEVYFFCGNRSRDDLITVLSKNHVVVHTKEVYRTTLTPVRLNHQKVKQVLFFSPSAVDSFFKSNNMSEDTKCVCIGTTTQNRLKKYSSNPAIIPSEPSIDGVLKSSVEYKEVT